MQQSLEGPPVTLKETTHSVQMHAHTGSPAASSENDVAISSPGQVEPPRSHSENGETPPVAAELLTTVQAEKSTATAIIPAESHDALVPCGEYPVSIQQSNGAIVSLNPTARRVAIGMCKAGISIAEGFLLSSRAVLNPIFSASLIAYESMNAVQAYRHGELTALGNRTTKGDVTLRIGKELTTMGLGMAIGHGVGALIGLSAIPVAGQFAVATVLSVGLGICLGKLLTHYVDRFMVRLQLRNKYGYPKDEHGTRRRFEMLMERRHDLSTLETCQVVQHYTDYRVACGWESAKDLDDYRSSSDITRMPLSLQHFAVIQLQRKWGFVKERAQCRQIYRALLLVHHPDRGGSTELAGQLNRDFEFFAFCQGWDNDCKSLLRGVPDNQGTVVYAKGASRRRRGNVVLDYLRSLFRPTTDSRVGANDLHQFGLLTLMTGTAAEMHRYDVTVADTPGDDGGAAAPGKQGSLGDIDSTSDEDKYEDTVAVATVRQSSVTRVLHALHKAYTATSEVITFSGLIHISSDAERWAQLLHDVHLFKRLQYFISMHAQAPAPNGHYDKIQPLCEGKEHVFHTFRWSTVQEAVVKREEARDDIIAAVFTQQTTEQLTSLLELWLTAKAMAESYLRVCQQREALGRPATSSTNDEGRQTLDALLRIHAQIEAAGTEAQASWQERLEQWATQTVPGFSSLIEDVKEVGLTASNALAVQYASESIAAAQEQCNGYFKAWNRKQDTLKNLLAELQLERATWKGNTLGINDGSPSSGVPRLPCDPEVNKRIEDIQTQLLVLHKKMAEVDVCVTEWASICAIHFPELTNTLCQLPSTCVEGMIATSRVNWMEPNQTASAQDSWTPRFIAFERERTLLHYTRVEVEPVNPLDPFTSRPLSKDRSDFDEWEKEAVIREEADSIGTLLYSFEANATIEDAVVGRHGVGVTLLQALYNDPLTGEITSCWLKRYSFAGAPGKEDVRSVRSLARRILTEEVSFSAGCSSDRVVSVRDVFYNRDRREMFLHYVRGTTQQRFRSVNDVRRQVLPLGLRWLHEVLECVACLHACQLAHGHIRLSAFTYDDFGNTALGVFHPTWESLNSGTTAAFEEPSLSAAPAPSLADRQHCDVLDVGIMLLTEVLPVFETAGRNSTTSPSSDTPSTTTPTMSRASKQPPPFPMGGAADPHADLDNMMRVMEAVAAHLVGKEEPRWSLVDARQFVRRFLQFHYGDLAIFSKQVVYPASWAIHGPAPPVQLVAVDTTPFRFPATSTVSATRVRIYQNRHVSLWETYWHCRRKMAKLQRGNHLLPPAIAQAPPILLCNDDCEVRERYLWCPCENEEVAWERCQDGFRALQRCATHLTPGKDMLPFFLEVPLARDQGRGDQWGLICRVALGTTIEQTQDEFATAHSEADTATAQYNKLSYAAKRRSHLVTPHPGEPGSEQKPPSPIWVPCPWARCYPEFILHTA